jgi:glyoxylase I family protein
MQLHHIALGARDVERVTTFYRDLFELPELERHHDKGGRLRSVWLDLGGAILMVERTDEQRAAVEGVGAGPFLLAVRCRPDERAALEQRLEDAGHVIEDRTAATSYARDPEGNRVAFSHYGA